MKHLASFLGLFTLFCLSACSAGNNAIGNWETDDHQHALSLTNQGIMIQYDQNMTERATATYTMRDSNTAVAEGGWITEVFTIKDNTLTIIGNGLVYHRVEKIDLPATPKPYVPIKVML